MNQSLAELFQKKHKRAGKHTINWDERRDTYLAAVEELYRQIEKILAEPIRKKLVRLRRRRKELTESFIGTYSVNDLLLTVGDEQVRFSPRGRNIAGATGRVDVMGERAEAILILRDQTQWVFVQSRQPELHVEPLNEATLNEVLRIVMRD
jgi:hypothetical protein